MLKVYGIPNCNTVKKARAWLDEQGQSHVFHDFKKSGVPLDRLDDWISQVGWEKLINRKGTTWRQLDDDTRALLDDARSGKTLVVQFPSVIKRPVLEMAGRVISVGFSEDQTPALKAHLQQK